MARLWVNYDLNCAIHSFWRGSLPRQYENTGYCYNQDAALKINLTNIFSHAKDVGVPVLSSDEYRAKIFVQKFSVNKIKFLTLKLTQVSKNFKSSPPHPFIARSNLSVCS